MFGSKDTKDGTFCPLIKGDCVRHKCAWFTKVLGNNPQTGKDVEDWGCAVTWIPILTIENSNQQRQTAASVDKVANQIHRQRAEFIGALTDEARSRIVQSDVKILENGSKTP